MDQKRSIIRSYIFQDPIDGVDLSRILLRAVDLDAELYPSLQIE